MKHPGKVKHRWSLGFRSWTDSSRRAHRNGGPAREFENGAKEWLVHGDLKMRQCEDGTIFFPHRYTTYGSFNHGPSKIQFSGYEEDET